MANLLKKPSSKDKYKDKDRDIVGRFHKPDGRCKKHPKHRQSPGVCSLCLSEKLIQLSSSSRRKTTFIAANSSSSSSVSSLSSYYSSSSASSCASPMHRRFDPGKRKLSSSLSFFLLNGKHRQLIKSRSMAVVPGRKEGEGGVDIKGRKKGGFWHKLLHPKSKRMNVNDSNKMVHSGSVTERVMVAN